MIKEFIDKLPQDKKDHIILGVIYSFFVVLLGVFFGVTGAFIGFVFTTFLNVWKEVWHDWRNNKGKPEVEDFIYNEIPILLVYIAFLC